MYFSHFCALTRKGPSGAEMIFYFPAVVSCYFFLSGNLRLFPCYFFTFRHPDFKMRKENQHFHRHISCLLHFLSVFVNSRKVGAPCSPQRSTAWLTAASLVLLLLLLISVEFMSAQHTHTSLCSQPLVPSHQQRSETEQNSWGFFCFVF